MRLAAVFSGAVLAALSVSSASAVVRITSDTGGQIGPYLETARGDPRTPASGHH